MRSNTTLTLGVSLLVLSLAAPGCTSSPEKIPFNELDVSLDEKVSADQLQEKPISAVAEVFNWQHFFKPTPKREERRAIEASLSAWQGSDNPEVLIKTARNQVTLGEILNAEATYRKLLRLEPGNIDAQLEIAQIYLRKKQLDRCFDFLVQTKNHIVALESTPKSVRFRYKYVLALALIQRQDRDQGHRILSELIADDKTFAPGYAALASSYFDTKKYDVAEFIAKRGLDRGKEDPRLTSLLGAIYIKQGDNVKAIRWIRRTLELDPNFAPALINRASLAIKRAEYEVAEKDLETAIGVVPDSVEAYISLGILQKKMGRYEASESSFRRAIDLNPESGHARFNLAILMADNFKNQNKALMLFHEVLQTSDQDDELKSLAKIHIEGIRDSAIIR